MTSESAPSPPQGPLSPAELTELESTLLPALERHHLRLLAHGLRTLQAIAAGKGPNNLCPETLPDCAAIRAWATEQPPIAGDPAFIEALTAQLESAGRQLEQLGSELGRPALGLGLGDLTTWATSQAEQRLRSGAPPCDHH
ncbi:MAG: hypothetical protein WD136_08585 [Cyanobium sp.]